MLQIFGFFVATFNFQPKLGGPSILNCVSPFCVYFWLANARD